LHATVAAFEKNAFTVPLVDQSQATPIRAQASPALDEIFFAQAKIRGNAGDVALGQFDFPRPFAAIGATLALVIDAIGFHEVKNAIFSRRMQPQVVGGVSVNEEILKKNKCFNFRSGPVTF